MSEPVRGFVIIHDDWQSHPNRTTLAADKIRQRLEGLSLEPQTAGRIAPDRTQIRGSRAPS